MLPARPRLQNRQAEDAKQRPPFKRWVAEEIIERQFQCVGPLVLARAVYVR